MKEFDLLNAMNELDEKYLLESEQPAVKVRKSKKLWKRPALIAACMCLVLTGTVLAVGGGGVLVNFLTGNEWFGENFDPADWPILEKFPIVGGSWVTSTARVPVEELSDEMRALAAEQGYESQAYAFESWTEMENFIGMEVADNPLLDAAEKILYSVHHESRVHEGPVEGYAIMDLRADLMNLKLISIYELYGTINVSVTASIITDLVGDDEIEADVKENFKKGALGRSYTQEQLDAMTMEEYTMANGRVATIVTTTEESVNAPEMLKEATGYFQGDAGIISVTVSDHRRYMYEISETEEAFAYYNQRVLDKLKEVLDAFE